MYIYVVYLNVGSLTSKLNEFETTDIIKAL